MNWKPVPAASRFRWKTQTAIRSSCSSQPDDSATSGLDQRRSPHVRL
jgi:hypothetical protein